MRKTTVATTILLLVLFSFGLFAYAYAEVDISNLTIDELYALQKSVNDAISRSDESEVVAKAIKVLKEYWTSEIYEQGKASSKTGYFEIKDTRIIHIKDDPKCGSDAPEATSIIVQEMFGDIDCIFEFILFTDYFGSAPYYTHTGLAETVAMKRDGSMEVIGGAGLFQTYRSKVYSADFSNIIESVEDCGSEYNEIDYLLDK